MNQNLPPNQQEPNNPYMQGGVQHSEPGVSSYGYQQASTQPDLDANAPSLKANELQRLNRKALVFLAGIIALLLLMAVWLVNRATSSNDDVKKQREETVIIPELPKGAGNDVVAVEPIPMAEPTIIQPPQLPPPPEDYMQPNPEMPAPVSSGPHIPTLAERRMMNGADGSGMGGGVGGSSAQNDPYMQALLASVPNSSQGSANKSESAKATSAQFINNPDSLLVRGTYIRCVLETRIITDIPGFTSCVVTEPVYSINGSRLLLPKGSKVSGSYNTEDPKFPRISVIWDRITTPNGIDVAMASPGVDNLGGAGHPGDYNAHWASKMSSALFISLVSDIFKYAGEKNGPTTTQVTTGGQVTQEPFQSNTAQTMERLANQVVDRNLSRPATVTINQGTVVNIYVAKDVSFAGVVAR
ncbi:MAG: TrbI/VirB10 family protein [Arenimonas sp.]